MTMTLKRGERRKGGHHSAVETVEIPSLRTAAKIAATRKTSQQDRADFARALADDVSARTKILLRKSG